MSLSKNQLETELHQLLEEKTIALKKMHYERVSQFRDKINLTLTQLEKLTSEEYIKIRFGYTKKADGYYPFFES